jgi:hypothetical protein
MCALFSHVKNRVFFCQQFSATCAWLFARISYFEDADNTGARQPFSSRISTVDLRRLHSIQDTWLEKQRSAGSSFKIAWVRFRHHAGSMDQQTRKRLSGSSASPKKVLE